MTSKSILIILNFIILILTIIWAYSTSWHDYEPIIGIFVAASTLIGLLFLNGETFPLGALKQNQKSGKGSFNAQSGRDTNIKL